MKFAPLYKRALNGKISEWIIETNENGYRTESGYVDGARTTSEWYPVEATNVGRSNFRSAADQAIFIVEKIIKDKKKVGWVEDIAQVDKASADFFIPMLAAKWEDLKNKIQYPVLVQPKLDGIRCIVKADGMWTRNGKQIVACPHIFETLKPLFEIDEDLILDGELYNHQLKEDFNKITSIVKKLKPTDADLEESKQMIQYHVYDIPSYKEKQEKRTEMLQKFSKASEYVEVVVSKLAVNEASVDMFHEQFVEAGYEGAMVRTLTNMYENKRSKQLLKMKTFQDEEFVIVGAIEGKASRAECLQSFVCVTEEGKEFNANANASVDQLKQWWIEKESLIGKKATVKFFHRTPDGIPRFPKVLTIDRIDV